MKVEVIENGIEVIPETEFEEGYLRNFLNNEREVVVRSGIDISNIVGLKVRWRNNDAQC